MSVISTCAPNCASMKGTSNVPYSIKEGYDPSKPVCDTQDDFNIAIDKAIKYTQNKEIQKAKPWMYVYSILFITFFFWAIILAMRLPNSPNKIIHLVFAIVFSPIYVISYYISMMCN
jgi:hypothetical protein